MIEKYYTTEAEIKRMGVVEGDVYKQEETTVATIKGHLQQADAELAEGFALERSRTFAFWCGLDTDVKIGDKVVLNGQIYGVKGVIDYAYGLNKHKEVVLWNTP